MTNAKIDIITYTKRPPLRMFIGAALQVGVIGIGVLTESTAMQWSGFVVLAVLVIGLSVEMSRKDIALTIPEAIARLKQLQEEQARP